MMVEMVVEMEVMATMEIIQRPPTALLIMLEAKT